MYETLHYEPTEQDYTDWLKCLKEDYPTEEKKEESNQVTTVNADTTSQEFQF